MWNYSRTVQCGGSGIIVSVDNSFKIGNKASVIEKGKSGTRLKVWKGGILTALNEDNMILAWVSSFQPVHQSITYVGLGFSGFARVAHLWS